jgi:restriction system protein
MKKESKGSEFVQWFGPILDALRELGGSAKAREVTELIARKQNL